MALEKTISADKLWTDFVIFYSFMQRNRLSFMQRNRLSSSKMFKISKRIKLLLLSNAIKVVLSPCHCCQIHVKQKMYFFFSNISFNHCKAWNKSYIWLLALNLNLLSLSHSCNYFRMFKYKLIDGKRCLSTVIV